VRWAMIARGHHLRRPPLRLRLDGYTTFMATRTPLRDYERHRVEPSHGLLHRAEEWAEEWVEETGFAPEGEPCRGSALARRGTDHRRPRAFLPLLEIAVAFGVAKLVTGHAY